MVDIKEIEELAIRAKDAGQDEIAIVMYSVCGHMASGNISTLANIVGLATKAEVLRIEQEINDIKARLQ